MNKKERTQHIADRIKETYQCESVDIVRTAKQARQYDVLSWDKKTVGFACGYPMESGEDITVVIPIAKHILYNEEHDFEESILATVGRYIMNHIELLQQAEEMKPHYDLIEQVKEW